MRIRLTLMGVPAALIVMLAAAQAQVVTDIETDGSVGMLALDFDGMPGSPQTFEIGEKAGDRSGTNLFHSFGSFDLGTDDTALFTATETTDNVFSRITGGAESVIDGLLRSDIPGADFYFFNRNGVSFRENARIDVRASFTASTADFVRFEDELAWTTGEAIPGSLSMSPPSAFGFTSDAPAPIVIDQSAPTASAVPLRVSPGHTFSLVGGDIQIRGRGDGEQTIAIDGNGTIQIASVAGPAEVPIDVAAFDVHSVPAADLGTVEFTNRAILELTGAGGGRVVIRGGRLTLAANTDEGLVGLNRITVGTSAGDAPEVAVDIEVAEEVEILDGSRIESSTLFAGRGGGISISAGSFLAAGAGTLVEARTIVGFGDGGDVRIDADRVEVSEGAVVSTETSMVPLPGSGSGGSIFVHADTVEVSSGGQLATNPLGINEGGAITIDAKAVHIVGTGSAVTATGRNQSGGSITVLADSVEVGDGGLIASLAAGSAMGGAITVEARSIDVSGGAAIVSDTAAGGAAGAIDLGTIDRPADLVRIRGTGSTVAANGADGPGGSITIRSDTLEVMGGGRVTVSAFGAAAAGSIVVEATEVVLDGTDEVGQPSSLLAQSVSGASGAAGGVHITAERSVKITNGAQISVASRSDGSGPTGDIVIDTGRLELRDSLEGIKATSFNENAGDIKITATDQVRVEDSSISARSEGASGGNIEIRAGNLILLRRRAAPPEIALVTAEVAPDQTEQGGNVILASDNVVVDRGGVRASAPGGVGGNITIEAEGFFVSGGDLQEARPGFFVSGGEVVELAPGVFASDGSYFDVSGTLDSGEFEIRSPDAAVVPDVASLSEDFVDVADLLADACAASQAPAGSLVVRGRDRTPPPLGDQLRILYLGES